MRVLFASSVHRLLLGLVVLGLVGGCSGKKISSGAGDQTMIPGAKAAPLPPPPPMEVAKEPPPTEPPPAVPPLVEPPALEPPPAPPSSPMELPRIEPSRPMEETRITEPPPAPPAEPVVPPAALPQIAQAPVAQPIEPPPPVEPSGSLQDVYFDFDQSVLRSDARATLEENAKMLRAGPSGKVLIEGHCDERGTSAYNLILGESRAKSVKRYLENLGIPASQLQVVSYGKERPFCKEHNDSCWASNRRAHFVAK